MCPLKKINLLFWCFLLVSVLAAVSVIAQKPSDILDVTNWKITMPYNTNQHPGNPDEIIQPLLEDFDDPNYYLVNASESGVIFRANCGAASTTNSKYPRCEYREMKMDDNTDEAAWSTDDGKIHKMEIIQAITHLPVVKPHVVAGQIHDAGDDLTVFRLERKKLFVDLNGNDGPVLTDNYTLGDVFTVAFIASNGKVTYEYNGEPVRDENGNIFELDCGSVKGCYFKAGCYTQSNVDQGDEPDAYGEVIIYSFFVSHGNEIHTHHTNTPIINNSSSLHSTNNFLHTEVYGAALKIQYYVFEPQPVTIRLLRVNGTLLSIKQLGTKGVGNHCESVSLENLSNGIYIVMLTINNICLVGQFVLMR